MASYPDAVKSFTTKNPSDVIASAHVNDLQDEVNALESGLLNGTARVNSSGLSVGGASTFAARPVMPPPHAALVYLDSTVTIGSSAQSTLSFLAQGILTNSSMHSTAANPERITPQSTGVYQVGAQITITANSSGSRQFDIMDSSGVPIAGSIVSSGSVALRLNVAGLKRYDVLGGYVTTRLITLGDQSTLSLSSGIGVSWLSLVKL